jgi:hypothetical protein
VKIWIAALAMMAFVGLASAQDDEKTPLDKLKESVAKKDPDEVKQGAMDTYVWAQKMVTAPKPTDANEVKDWESRVESGKEVTTYTEYALSATAIAVQATAPAKTIELVDALLAQNPKSKYLNDTCANAYLVALGKGGGSAKQLDGMAKIAKGRPDNITALMALIDSRPSAQYANELVAAARKPKPEDIPEGEWEKLKNEALGKGYFHMGNIAGQKQGWVDCEKYMKQALPLIQGGSQIGTAYFTLGICEFNFGKATMDKSKMKEGQSFMEKAAATKGPYQSQAYSQNNAMKQALATGR